jgi:hypothetical protein
MSYPGIRRAHFSNPNVLYDGQPTGVPIGETGQAYNVQTINVLASWHEDYRVTRFDMWVDFTRFCYALPCEGTYAAPYSTLNDAVTAVPASANSSELPTVWIKSGASSATMTIDKAMTLRTCDGPATIGATP